VIGIGERVEGDRREEMSEEEGEVNATSPRRVLVLRTLTPNNHIKGVSLILKMVNQDSTLRLPMFHGRGKDDVEQHWFMCEAIWSVKRITYEATKIAQLETMFRDKALMWYMKYKATVPARHTRSLIEIKEIYLRNL
jgi:hypothetical protein